MCGCCKRDSSEILAGGRVIRFSVGNYCDNNSDQQNDNTNLNSWNFRSYISAMRHVQACSTFEVRSDSNARMGSSRILRHVSPGRYLKITSVKPYCKYNTSDRHQAEVL